MKRPLYFRILRVRHLKARPWVVFVLFEGSIAVGILLALAEFISWWGVLAIPVAVAAMVKINDVVAGAMLEPLAAAQLRTPRMVARRASGSAGVPRPSRMTTLIDEDDAVADVAARPDVVRGVAQPRYRGTVPMRRPQPGNPDPEPPIPDHAPVETVSGPVNRPDGVGRRNQGRFSA
jgi:hypothetical protein